MTVEQEEHIPIYLVTEQKAMNGPIVAIECVSSRAAQILHCHPFRPIQSNHRVNANGRFELMSGLDVNKSLVEENKQSEACLPKFVARRGTPPEQGSNGFMHNMKQFTV